MDTFFTWLDAAAQRRADAGLTRAARPSDTEVIDLAGNDYLGLRTHPAVIAAAVSAAQTYGGGAGASRLVTGTLPIHEELETALAALAGAPSALVFSTGYAANLAVLTALTDSDTLIVSDAHVHASLIDGARLSKAEVKVVSHNAIDEIEAALSARRHSRALVVVESIYSVLGDAAPLEELVALTRTYDAVLVVDEAHGLGVRGPRGGGLLSEIASQDLAHIVVTGTLSKSFGSQGGVVLAHKAVREHLINTARPFIYDTGLAPAAAGAALGALEVLAATPSLLTDLSANTARLASALNVESPAGAVLSVPMPSPQAALHAVDQAAAQGIRIGCFRPPSTPDGISRLRLTAHAGHDELTLNAATSVLEGLR